MFYVQTRTYKARVGPIAQTKTETCEHCHKAHDIMAHAWGEGSSVAMYDFSGGRVKNQEAAFEAASRNATATALAALQNTACPSCGRVSAALQQEVEEAERAYRRRLRLAAFVPLAFGVVAFLPFAWLGVRALAYSAWPLTSGLSVGAGVFSFVLTVLLWPRRHPLRPTAAMLFYRPVPAESAYRGDGPEEAFAPWPILTKPAKSFGSGGRAGLALVASMGLLVLGGIGLQAKKTQYESLHILSMAPPGTMIRVSQPGTLDQTFEVERSSGDAFHAVAKVLRLDAPHPITVTEEGPNRYTASFAMPPLKRRVDTPVLALGAAAAGKCLAYEKKDEGLTPERPSNVHPDLLFARSYASTWLKEPPSEYSFSYRLLPCADASAREVRIASLAAPGTKFVLSQAGKEDQVFTVGTHTSTDAYLVRARVYESESSRFTLRQGGTDYEQTFVLPSDPPPSNLYLTTKPAWLVVAGASAQKKCVAIFTSYYGDGRLVGRGGRGGLGALGALGSAPPLRKLAPTATDLWSVPHVDIWLSETPKSVTGPRYQNLSRSAVRIQDCTVLDVVSRLGSPRPSASPKPSTAHDDESDDDDTDDVPPKPAATVGTKGRPTSAPSKPR